MLGRELVRLGLRVSGFTELQTEMRTGAVSNYLAGFCSFSRICHKYAIYRSIYKWLHRKIDKTAEHPRTISRLSWEIRLSLFMYLISDCPHRYYLAIEYYEPFAALKRKWAKEVRYFPTRVQVGKPIYLLVPKGPESPTREELKKLPLAPT
jgi:hypothetical protein